jgi:hypothetical protein
LSPQFFDAFAREISLSRLWPAVSLAVAPLRSEVTRLSPLNVYDDDDVAEDGR